VWTQKKGNGMCCHECGPRRKEMECAVVSVDPEERKWNVLPRVYAQKKGEGVCCHECLSGRKEKECVVMSVDPEEMKWSVLP